MTKSNRLPCGRSAPRENMSRKTKLTELQSKLRAHVEAHDLKNSESRNRILEVIAAERSHFNAQELVKRVVSHSSEVGAATVYRNIPVLLAAGVIQESLVQESGETLYELTDEDHHDHIVCVDCGAIFEFHEEVIEKAQDKVMSGLKFKSVRHKHVVYAECGYGPRSKKGNRS